MKRSNNTRYLVSMVVYDIGVVTLINSSDT